MGLFDTVHWEYPLPDAQHQDLELQTKNLDLPRSCLCSAYDKETP